jgi:hypothetical protein
MYPQQRPHPYSEHGMRASKPVHFITTFFVESKISLPIAIAIAIAIARYFYNLNIVDTQPIPS